MIKRYTRDEMGKIWDEKNKFDKWLLIELLAVEAWLKLGVIPEDKAKIIKEKAKYDIDRINEIEQETHHDVIAFLTSVSENIGTESRYIHYGMTSSDILDTTISCQLKEAGNILHKGLCELRDVFANLAKKYKNTVMIGRSHGIHAEPITFGFKIAVFYSETIRNIERLKQAIDMISVGQISGPVGTFSNINPFVEEYVCEKLGLVPAKISTQIIQRDRHAHFLSTLAIIGSSLEKFAIEIRHLQRTEVLEVEEYFSKGQKGSSAMPHKKNPIISERIAGLARILRGNALAGMENIALWHERDISHSSVERIILPDSTILLDYMIHKTIFVFKDINVYPLNMEKNMAMLRDIYFSQTIMLRLIDKGLTREEAYKIVQENAMKVWENENNTLQELLKQDSKVNKILCIKEISDCFKLENLLKNQEKVFERLGL